MTDSAPSPVSGAPLATQRDFSDLAHGLMPTDADVEAVEEAVGMGCGAWDMVKPTEILREAWRRYEATRTNQPAKFDVDEELAKAPSSSVVGDGGEAMDIDALMDDVCTAIYGDDRMTAIERDAGIDALKRLANSLRSTRAALEEARAERDEARTVLTDLLVYTRDNITNSAMREAAIMPVIEKANAMSEGWLPSFADVWGSMPNARHIDDELGAPEGTGDAD